MLESVAGELRSAGAFAFDTETTGLDPMQADLCGISLACGAGEAWYVPIRSPEPDTHLDESTVLGVICPLLADESLEDRAQSQVRLNIMRRAGVAMQGPFFDTMIAPSCSIPHGSSHGMDALALSAAADGVHPHQHAHRQWLQAHLRHRAAGDGRGLCGRGCRHHLAAVRAVRRGTGGRWVWSNSSTTSRCRSYRCWPAWNTGHSRRSRRTRRQRNLLDDRAAELRTAAIDASPHPFNPDSPKQLAAVLFNDPKAEPPGLGLTPVKQQDRAIHRSGGARKADADPAVDDADSRLLLEYRQLASLVGTYLVALKDAIDPDTHRVHTSFHQTGAATGRLSSVRPNLQNIPIRTEEGVRFAAFKARPGHRLIAADYSQVELRLLADLSHDEPLIAAFDRGDDIHRAVAAEVFEVEPDDVDADQRNAAKMINFGIVYGITAWGLARRLGDSVRSRMPRRSSSTSTRRDSRVSSRSWMNACRRPSVSDTWTTIYGRRRAIAQLESNQPQVRELGKRLAINSVVQGSAADPIKIAMIPCRRGWPATVRAPPFCCRSTMNWSSRLRRPKSRRPRRPS